MISSEKVTKFGPRRLIAIGTVMAGMSWVLSAQVKGLATLWLVYGCMGGLGTGIVYIRRQALHLRRKHPAHSGHHRADSDQPPWAKFFH
jgi:hypothetical protein